MGKVEWVTFACVAMPRQIFMEVGELDDRFQNDSEDFDFCRRVRKMQGHCYYSYGSFVFHFCGVSRDAVDGGNSSIERQEMLGKNAAIRESKRQRENKTVRFYVGRSWEPWLPETVDETGIGGSETCVVNVARCLSQMGWNVEVFSTEERYPLFRDGVTYYPHTMFNPASPCDILIVCRKPEVFDLDLNAKLKILYNHDATYGGPPSPGQPAYQYPTEERLANMDYLFMLSRWHLEHFLEQYPHIPEEKMVLTQNGIDLRRFERHLQGFIPKDPKRFVYSSSGDRGLEALLQIWPMLKDLDPNFRLHLYYGLETWKKIAASRGDENTMARIEKVVKMSSQPGIVTHGRIGQRQLAQEFAMSNLWLYPTWFHETSCITAMEAMVTGNRPITTPLAALTETAITARFVEGDCTTEEYQQQFAQEIIDELNSPQSEIRIEGIKKTIKKYDWRKVVSLWDKMFINELEKIEKTKPKKRKPVNKETVHFVLPYGGSGGVQYPIELARSLNETDELRTKISIVKFANEDGDLSDILPKYDHIKTYEFDEFRLDPDLAFDCQHIVAVNWQTTLLLREMGANRRVDLKRYTMIQGDERAWAPMHHLSAQMSDQAWAKIYVSEYLRNAFQVPGPVIPNGFSIDQFTPDENSPQRDQKMIGCIIHQSPIKNTSIILDAIKDLEGDARLLSVVAAPELKGNQRIADVSYDVIWGPVSKSSIAEAMFRCGAWIVPSIEEGFGLVGLEAMAAGCILITASPGGMRTYVKPDENSIRVFNPKSKSQWANMIKAYLTGDPGEIATMRENARHTAEKFSLDVATEKFATFLLGGEVE